MMSEWICMEVETENGGYLEPVKPLVRCEHCEEHRNRVGICDVWHAHTPPWGWCYRGRKYGKTD